jgi:gluconolactonase
MKPHGFIFRQIIFTERQELDKCGQQIEQIPVPEGGTANATFGGKDRDLLFITASKSVYGLKMRVQGPR